MYTEAIPDVDAAIRRHLRIWLRLTQSTDRAERAVVERLTCSAYHAVGLQSPQRILWCDSPLATVWARSISTEIWQEQVGPNVKSILVDEPLQLARRRAFHGLSPGFRRKLITSLDGGLLDETRALQQAQWDSLCEGVHSFDGMPDRVRQHVVGVLNDNGFCGIDLAPFVRIYYGLSGGAYFLDHDGAITMWFARNRLCLKAATQGVVALMDLLPETHFFIPHENVCWISERPITCDGTGAEYADGWRVEITEKLRNWQEKCRAFRRQDGGGA